MGVIVIFRQILVVKKHFTLKIYGILVPKKRKSKSPLKLWIVFISMSTLYKFHTITNCNLPFNSNKEVSVDSQINPGG